MASVSRIATEVRILPLRGMGDLPEGSRLRKRACGAVSTRLNMDKMSVLTITGSWGGGWSTVPKIHSDDAGQVRRVSESIERVYNYGKMVEASEHVAGNFNVSQSSIDQWLQVICATKVREGLVRAPGIGSGSHRGKLFDRV